MKRIFLMAVLVVGTILLGPASAWAHTVTLTTNENGKFGRILTDSQGRSVYLFKADKQGKAGMNARSECYGACAEVWPPLLTNGAPMPGSRVDASLIGTTKRKDGSRQVTYNGWPLYYYRSDMKPGQTNGEDNDGFGADWLLLTPQGQAIHNEG